MSIFEGAAPSRSQAVQRYEEIQGRLPSATFPASSIHKAHLGELTDYIDAFVLDGFGVLNIGDQTVPGAVDRVNDLRAAGKQVRVLTNGASMPVTTTLAKYKKWGMHFEASEVVSSRDALARKLTEHQTLRWGFSGREESELHSLVPDAVLLEDDPSIYESCDGFVLLGAGTWNLDRQALLQQALSAKARPVLVGNPDLVAPLPEGLSREPGLFAHALEDAKVAVPEFFGKPFDNAFAIVRESLEGIDPARIAMVGDTLHTDILGGAQAGWKTVLITGHGLLRGLDVEAAIASSGIRPDFIIPTT